MHAIICLNTSSSICCCPFGPTHLGECDPQLGYVIQLVAHLRSHPINAVRPWSALPQGAARRQSWPAPTASSNQPLADWLHPALSGQARSAREEAEVKETGQIVNDIAADQVNHRA
jgi:hypothetical protein